MQQPAQYLFVYGTLMSTFTNPAAKYLQQSAAFVAKAATCGLLYDVGRYPAFIATPNCTQQVYGELWALPPNPQPLPLPLPVSPQATPRPIEKGCYFQWAEGGVVCGDTNNGKFIYVHCHCRFRTRQTRLCAVVL
ncbi:gamma-glutamylcyclotransferase [Sphingobacteriales bacterium UPWRP_1]|nr:hypothetical protein BVG80_12650 [Sphingobacteriales bacterium TSM_CSM]PSJ77876.1 gamma-glutamylcyclotransferase [Sphingobacteriales bacterium UPWRP_1]